jgi:hypothetical protein
MARGVSLSLEKRLRSRCVVDKETGCIIFTGFKNPQGYGMININGTPTLVHRLALMLAENLDSIPPRRLVRHKCRSRACVNPAHLEFGSKKENSADMRRDKSLPQGEKHASAKISRKVALAIIASHGTATQKERAESFGVTLGIVKSIDKRATWAHLRPKEEHDAAIEKRADREEGRRAREKERRKTTPYLVTQDFFDRHDKTKIVCKDKGCWIKSETRRDRYITASMRPFEGYLHRMMWEFAHNKGEHAPEKLVVRHKCHVKGCFNPEHLEIGTQQDNAHDNVGKEDDKRYRYTVEQVQAYRALREDGVSIKDAATEMDIHYESARTIDARRSWKTV